VGTAKRERQKANRQSKLERALAEQKKAKRNRQWLLVGSVIAAVVAFFLLYSLLTGGDDESVETADTVAEAPEQLNAQLPTVAPGKTLTGDTPCPKTDGSEERVTTFEKAPPTCIDPAKTYQAKVTTTEGELVITLDAKNAPATVNNFVVLSRYRYYEGVPFHRIVSGFVAQFGDANPTDGRYGGGGPGYAIDDELPASAEDYQRGAVAMANSGPNTNGSQIFLVEGWGQAPAAYSLFGKVTEGLDSTFPKIMAAGSPGQDGQPTKVITIDKIEIVES
jgi:cyclophilin family peptidyl-prolyl cis-trans isomerase